MLLVQWVVLCNVLFIFRLDEGNVVSAGDSVVSGDDNVVSAGDSIVSVEDSVVSAGDSVVITGECC